MPLTLLVPDLLAPADAPRELRELRLPGLEKWLARADVAKSAGLGAGEWLAREWSLPQPPPYAALARIGEGGTPGGAWLRADPVHLRIERDLVALHDASILDVTAREAAELVATLNALIGEDGLVLEAPAPDRWYLRIPEGEAPVCTPLEKVLGRDVFGHLPRGSGRINWRSMLTEAQMLFSSHEVNARREARGQPAINSVWFWGEGHTPERTDPRYARVHSGDALARGLAAHGGCEAQAVPDSLAALAGAPAVEVLVTLDALTRAYRANDTAHWSAAARRLDAGWFAPLGDSIARFGRIRIVLPSEAALVVATLEPAARWRWLRASRPLASHA